MNPHTHKVGPFFHFHQDPVSPLPQMCVSAVYFLGLGGAEGSGCGIDRRAGDLPVLVPKEMGMKKVMVCSEGRNLVLYWFFVLR